jgi:acyl-ACP thioesterase
MINSKTKNFEIHYYEKDRNNKASIITILNYLEEMAIEHSDACGASHEEMLKQDLAWVLYKWKVRMYRYPSWKETISVTTWSCGIEGLYAYRGFRIHDSEGRMIGEALSVWLVFKFSTRRLQRIPQNIIDQYPSLGDFVLKNELSDDLLSGADILLSSSDYVMKPGDSDENRHVNNIRYVELALSNIPVDLYDDKLLTDIEVIYKKECYPGDNVQVTTQSCPSAFESSTVLISTIKPADSSSSSYHAVIRSTWG